MVFETRLKHMVNTEKPSFIQATTVADSSPGNIVVEIKEHADDHNMRKILGVDVVHTRVLQEVEISVVG